MLGSNLLQQKGSTNRTGLTITRTEGGDCCNDSCAPCQTTCVVLGWLLLLRWLHNQGAALVLEKGAEEMLSLGLLRRSPVCDTADRY